MEPSAGTSEEEFSTHSSLLSPIMSRTVAAISARFEKEILSQSRGNEYENIKKNGSSNPKPGSSITPNAQAQPVQVEVTKPERAVKTKRTESQKNVDNKYLLGATKEGNIEVVKWLITHGADPNLQDGKGRSALLTAACNNRMDVFKYLLDKSDINAVDQNGWDIVHIAAVSGQLKLIQEVKDKLPLNTRSRSGLTPLCLATNKGHLQIIEYLLKEGADVKLANNQGWIALHFAAKGKNFPALYTLINSGSCKGLLNARTVEGQTPLSLATQEGSFDCVRLLLDSGANPSPKDNRGWTPARIAAINNFTNIMQYLANYGASM